MMIWWSEPSRVFLVRSAYKLLQSHSLPLMIYRLLHNTFTKIMGVTSFHKNKNFNVESVVEFYPNDFQFIQQKADSKQEVSTMQGE